MSDITERLRAPRCGLSMFASAADRDMYNVATREEAADEIDRLRAANARLQAWHDVVVAARVVDAVDIGTAAMVLRQANGRILELQDAVDEIERRSVKAIIRPQPLAKE